MVASSIFFSTSLTVFSTFFSAVLTAFLALVAVVFVAFSILASAFSTDFVALVSFTSAFLANLATAALRREAVFFLIRPFLAALSYSDWILDRVAVVGLALNALRADLMDFLIC